MVQISLSYKTSHNSELDPGQGEAVMSYSFGRRLKLLSNPRLQISQINTVSGGGRVRADDEVVGGSDGGACSWELVLSCCEPGRLLWSLSLRPAGCPATTWHSAGSSINHWNTHTVRLTLPRTKSRLAPSSLRQYPLQGVTQCSTGFGNYLKRKLDK